MDTVFHDLNAVIRKHEKTIPTATIMTACGVHIASLLIAYSEALGLNADLVIETAMRQIKEATVAGLTRKKQVDA